jgi:hypothetical protein
MSRARGNKSSKAAIASRQAKEREMIEENPGVLDQLTQAEIAQAVGATNRLQVQRDLAQISKPLQLENSTAFEQIKRAQLQTYELMERSLIEGKISPDIAREWRGIRSEVSRLLGLNAPTKTISATVNADVDPATLPEYRRWLFETRYMSKDGHEKVYAYIRAERLNVREAVAVEVPTSSPLWNDAPKQLEEGEK